MHCLGKLLEGRIGLSRSKEQQQQQQQRQQQQGGSDVFAAYTQALVSVAAAVLQGIAGGVWPAGSSSSSNARKLGWALYLLLLLVEAAPNARASRQLKQQLQLGLWQQLSAAAYAAARGGSASCSEGAAGLLGLWHKLEAGLSAACGDE
jgi:hypothetical protein